MKKYKNLVIGLTNLIFFICLCFCFKVNSFAENIYGFDFDVKSEAVYFVNEDTGTVVYEKNRNKAGTYKV